MVNKKTKQEPVYILDGVRTPISNPFMSLKSCTAMDLAAAAIKGLIKKTKLPAHNIDEVILGQTVTAGTGQNVARQSALKAGLPQETPAYLINNVCGSSLQALESATALILSQKAECVLIGGTESATHNPYLVNREDAYNNLIKKSYDSMFVDGLYCSITKKSMGELAEALVKKHKLLREDLDIYAYESNQKAVEAWEKGYFKEEIAPVVLKSGKIINKDDRPRKNLKLENLWGLSPAFKKTGFVTAGNSSIPCDGAVAFLVVSERFLKKHGFQAKARILEITKLNINPQFVFESTGPVVVKCLKQTGLSLSDIDAFEIGEAFAAQMAYFLKTIKIPPQKINMFGGDLALGHPLGISGARNLVTLLNILRQKRLKRGMVAVSFGGEDRSPLRLRRNEK